LKELRQWDGAPVPEALRQRLLREFERLQVVNRQVRQLEQQRIREVRQQQSPAADQVRRLLGLRGIGLNSSWLYVHEFFAWRKFRNRRQVGSLSGLAPTPYSSGQSDREQGISKAGNKRMRWMAVEIAWGWLHFQPDSELTRWFVARFGRGSSRQRRIGIVALARKLLVQLWKYLQTGVPPAGAELTNWRTKTKVATPALATG
jgi:transposase